MKPTGSVLPSFTMADASTIPIGPFCRNIGIGSDATGLPLAAACANIGPITEWRSKARPGMPSKSGVRGSTSIMTSSGLSMVLRSSGLSSKSRIVGLVKPALFNSACAVAKSAGLSRAIQDAITKSVLNA
jgi:hypothetical protein